jgi:molybdopterin/thiamine biosynthesis adenylyltransferase
MRKILIIGCGGIGGYVAREVNRLILNDQIDIDDVEFSVVDNDIVELKNIKYQNFTKSDLFKNKAKVIGERYCFMDKQKRINTADELKGFDLIVIAVDNSQTRKMVFDYCYNSNADFIDLRAEGRAFAFFTKGKGHAELLQTLGQTISDEGSSCQLKYELEAGIIQNGNVVVATIGSQLILNWLRGENNPTEMRMRI